MAAATMSVRMAEDLDLRFLRSRRSPLAASGDEIKVVDLFAGCGGLTLGALEGARRTARAARLSLAIDYDPAPLAVLQATLGLPDSRFSDADFREVLAPIAGRVRATERRLFRGGRADLLLAGPPCQGHSALNNHTRHDDPRNNLYLAVARVARLTEPKAVIVENVSGVGRDRSRSLDRCIAALQELGYEVDARRVDLHQIGVAQRRIRHVLVATLDRPFDWELIPAATGRGRDVRWAIGDLLDTPATSSLDHASVPTAENQRRIEWLFANDAYNLPNAERPACHQGDHTYLSMYGRLRWDAPAQTITSGYGTMGQGRFVHPLRPRTLTPHEAARLQFLPDYLQFAEVENRRTALARMIGNAVPPKLGITLTEALIGQGVI